MYSIATVVEHRQIYDRPASLDEIVSLIRELDPVESAILLCQMNADFRLTKPDRGAVARVQQEIAGGLLSDEAIRRLKERLGTAHAADRPLFHPVQLLNLLRLTAAYGSGKRSPLTDASARYDLGSACLMMNDVMMTAEERIAVASGDRQSVMGSLMTQMLGPFEVQNAASIVHTSYRARIMFDILLKKQSVLDRISRQCQGFDFEYEFSRIANVSLSRWQFLLTAFYAYLMQYSDGAGTRRHEFLAIDRLNFARGTSIPQCDLDASLRSLSTDLGELRNTLTDNDVSDWRFDEVPLRSKPFLELRSGKYYCADIRFLTEKIHSGAYWTIHDGLGASERRKLSNAWGILFEEYVNWFLAGRAFKDFCFWPAPAWQDRGEDLDGAFARRSVFIPMEYKGGFLLRGAKYSGDQTLFEVELESKIVKGCKQLARKIEKLFDRRREQRKTLRDVPLDHITRVVPVLVVQDQILGGPLVNWRLNQRFNELLDRSCLRSDVTVDSLNVVGIRELEAMAECAEAGSFDLFHALQLKCYVDPEMVHNLNNFLLDLPEYGIHKSDRIRAILEELSKETMQYLFGPTEQSEAPS